MPRIRSSATFPRRPHRHRLTAEGPHDDAGRDSTEFPDLLGSGMVTDPYPVYHRLRAADRALARAFQAWVLTRYDDILPALRPPPLLGPRHAIDGVSDTGSSTRSSHWSAGVELHRSAAAHAARRIVSKAFTPHAVAALRPRLQGYVDQLLDRVQGQGRMDVIGDFAFPLPPTVILGLLGVPVEARRTGSRGCPTTSCWCCPTTPRASRWRAMRERLEIWRLTEHFSGLVAERRSESSGRFP